MPIGSGGSFLRQLSGKEPRKSSSRRWNSSTTNNDNKKNGFGFSGFNSMYGSSYCDECFDDEIGNIGDGFASMQQQAMRKKRVMVVVDQHSSHSKHAMMWALTHVANKGDFLSLLHIIPPPFPHEGFSDSSSSSSYPNDPQVATFLGSLCKACNRSRPEVEVEALAVQGQRLATVISQVKKLEVTFLVLGQKKPSSSFFNCVCGTSGSERFVEQCINNAECMTVGVRKRSKGKGGYIINTKWQKNFWLLA